MNKIDIKILIWGIIGATASYAALNSTSFTELALLSVVAILALFIVDIASYGFIYGLCNAAYLLAAYVSGSFASVIVAAALFVIPAFGMAEIIKLKKDFSITLCCGSGLLCLGIMIIDRAVAVPKIGGLRIVFGSVVDAIIKSAAEISDLVSPSASVEAYGDIATLIQSVGYTMKLMFPAFVLVFALAVVFFVLILSRHFIPNIPVPPFFLVRVPKVIAYIYCIGYIFGGMLGTSDAGLVFTNSIMVLSAVMLICGVSVLRYFTKRIPSKALSMLVFLFALPVCFSFPVILTAAGTADAVFNFRRLGNEKK